MGVFVRDAWVFDVLGFFFKGLGFELGELS